MNVNQTSIEDTELIEGSGEFDILDKNIAIALTTLRTDMVSGRYDYNTVYMLKNNKRKKSSYGLNSSNNERNKTDQKNKNRTIAIVCFVVGCVLLTTITVVVIVAFKLINSHQNGFNLNNATLTNEEITSQIGESEKSGEKTWKNQSSEMTIIDL